MNEIRRLDGRHKLAIVGALVCWALSMYFSKEGFSVGNTVMLWVGWVLASIVTVVELVFNSPTQKLSLTLIVVGVLCYLYGIWTNVTGFWEIQHPTETFVALSSKSVLSWFVGFIMEVLPEPLFMWGVTATFDGDLIGNLAGLWSGSLPYAQPNHKPEQVKQNNQPFHPSTGAGGKFKQGNNKSPYKAQYKPEHIGQGQMMPGRPPQYQEPTYHPIGMQQKPPYPPESGYIQAVQREQNARP